MKWSQISSCILAAATGMAWLLHAPVASAFSEDICFLSNGGAPFTCSPLPAACQPVGTTTAACLAAASAVFIGEDKFPNNIGAKRSIVHADCVNLLAQAAGFSTDDANWISSYGEVPDYGQFGPTDMTGQPYSGGDYQTALLDGFERTNFSIGGAMYHFVSLYNGGAATPPPGIDGLHPNPQAAHTEYFVAHVRNWAMAGSGTSPPICTAALTNQSQSGDYATGTSCFTLNSQPAQVAWTWEVLAVAAKTYLLNTGLQVIVSSNSTPSSSFDTVVGNGATRVADARLGIYAHVLADRISHQACTITSSMAGPMSVGPSTWSQTQTNSIYCQQDYHGLFHMWEAGVNLASVPPANRTTEATLNLLYDEMVAFAAARNTVRSGVSNAATKSALVTAMLSAVGTPDTGGRIAALARVACANGYQPFPGAPTCGSLGVTSNAAKVKTSKGPAATKTSKGPTAAKTPKSGP